MSVPQGCPHNRLVAPAGSPRRLRLAWSYISLSRAPAASAMQSHGKARGASWEACLCQINKRHCGTAQHSASHRVLLEQRAQHGGVVHALAGGQLQRLGAQVSHDALERLLVGAGGLAALGRPPPQQPGGVGGGATREQGAGRGCRSTQAAAPCVGGWRQAGADLVVRARQPAAPGPASGWRPSCRCTPPRGSVGAHGHPSSGRLTTGPPFSCCCYNRRGSDCSTSLRRSSLPIYPSARQDGCRMDRGPGGVTSSRTTEVRARCPLTGQ